MNRFALAALAAPLLIAVAAAQTVPPVATTEPPSVRDLRVVPPAGPAATAAQLAANKRIVLQWHYEFFDLGHFREANDKYMAKDFQQTNKNEKSGADAYAHEFETNGYKPRPAAERPPLTAVFAQGDLVMTVIPDPAPGGGWDTNSIHCNMYRLKNGRITAMWVSGTSAPPAPPAK